MSKLLRQYYSTKSRVEIDVQMGIKLVEVEIEGLWSRKELSIKNQKNP